MSKTTRDPFEAAGIPAPNNMTADGKRGLAQEACAAYREQGLSYLFWKVSYADMMQGRGKGPRTKGWERLEYNMPPDGGHYQVGIMVGTQIGPDAKRAEEAGLWLCCVDIDDPALQELAEKALPDTRMRGGKESTPRSHLFFLTKRPVNTFKWQVPEDPNRGTKARCAVEIFGVTRAGEAGHQMASYPSSHFRKDGDDTPPTCQRYVWDSPELNQDGSFAGPGIPGRTTPEELFEACARIAAACPGAVLVTGKGLPAAWVQPAAQQRMELAEQSAANALETPQSQVWKLSKAEMERVILTAYARVASLEKGNRQAGLNREAFCAASVLAGAGAPDELFDQLKERLIAAMDELREPFDSERAWTDTVYRSVDDGRAKPRRRSTLQAFGLTDQGTADLLVHEWRDEFRYVWQNKQWLRWAGNRWRPVQTVDVERATASVFRWAVAEATESPAENWRKNAIEWYFKCESGAKAATITHLLSAAKGVGGLSVGAESLDADPWAFCCANGVFDMRTGELREGRRDDLMTKQSPFKYVKGARSAMFDKMLDWAYGESPEKQAMIDYLLSWLGYAATGSNAEQKVLILHGWGQNGKSSLLSVVHSVLGEYATKTLKEVFVQAGKNGSGKNSDEVAELQGRRFGYFSELAENDFLDEGRIKSLTGDSTVKAMQKYGKPFDFRMQCTLFVDTNYKPRIRGTDFGIIRRVKLLPFARTIPDEARDPQWAEKLIEREGDALLSMLLDEAHKYYLTRSLAPEPEQVKTETKIFLKENDTIGTFLDDCCVTETTDEKKRQKYDIKDGADRLYQAFRAWCTNNGCCATQSKLFYMKLKERGFESRRTRLGVLYYGVELRVTPALVSADELEHAAETAPAQSKTA